MSNVLNLLSEEAYLAAMEKQATLLAAIAMKSDAATITSWTDVQRIVRMGMADKVFSIGDQFACKRGEKVILWNVIGIDFDKPADKTKSHSLTLQAENCITNFQFDAAEALYYAEAELPAGTYHFTLTSNYDTEHGGGKVYQFTLLQDLPAGGQIVFPWSNGVQAASVKISTYASRTATAPIETVAVAEGSGGTALGEINHASRIRYGSNNYGQSAIRMWLNSEKGANEWWSPMSKYDRPSAGVATPGFLNGMDDDFLRVIGKTSKVSFGNAKTDGGKEEQLSDKFFLLSRAEVYGGKENESDDGRAYPYYSAASDLAAAGLGNDGNRIKKLDAAARYWWLRSPYASDASYIHIVYPAGNINSSNANSANGVTPACCIV